MAVLVEYCHGHEGYHQCVGSDLLAENEQTIHVLHDFHLLPSNLLGLHVSLVVLLLLR